jgi:hypothetical protein
MSATSASGRSLDIFWFEIRAAHTFLARRERRI